MPPAAGAQVIMERNVSMAMARAIVDGAVEQCQKDGHRVVVVVVDRAGADGGDAARRRHQSTQFRIGAAQGLHLAARIRQITTEFFHRTEKQPSTGLRNLPDVIWSGGGGAPIKVGNETIGGVGVSGAPGGTGDDVCAAAGIARIADQLK